MGLSPGHLSKLQWAAPFTSTSIFAPFFGAAGQMTVGFSWYHKGWMKNDQAIWLRNPLTDSKRSEVKGYKHIWIWPFRRKLCEYKGCFLHGPRPCAPEEQLYQVFFKGGCGNMEWPWTPKPTPEAVGNILHLCIDNKLGTIYVFTTCLYGSTIVYDIGCMMMYIYMYILYTPKKLSFHLSVPSIWSIWSTKDSLVWPPWHTLDTSGRQAHVARSLRFILYIKGKIDENWTKRIANTTLVRDKFQHLTRRENHSYPHHW